MHWSHIKEDATDQFITTNQGVKINDDQNSLKAGERDQPCWKILFSGKDHPF